MKKLISHGEIKTKSVD